MQRSNNAQTNDRGFTLTEMLVTMIVAGVLAALTAPSLVGLLNRNQINEAQRQVESALREAQRQAIRRGKSCSVEIDTTSKTISSPDSGCLLSQRDVGENTLVGGDTVSLKPDNSTITIEFTHKGATSSNAVIVIESTLNNTKKCVAIAGALGAVKTGVYTGALDTTLTLNNCNPAD